MITKTYDPTRRKVRTAALFWFSWGAGGSGLRVEKQLPDEKKSTFFLGTVLVLARTRLIFLQDLEGTMARTLTLLDTSPGHCWVEGEGTLSHCLGEGRNLETRQVLYLFVAGIFFFNINSFFVLYLLLLVLFLFGFLSHFCFQ